jgi:hypothetical protein
MVNNIYINFYHIKTQSTKRHMNTPKTVEMQHPKGFQGIKQSILCSSDNHYQQNCSLFIGAFSKHMNKTRCC